MHRLIVLLTALLVPLAVADEFPPQAAPVQKYFALACKYVECGDLEAPMVIFKDTAPALGYYHLGTHVVFIAKDCLYSQVADQTMCEAVLIHEMVHYIESQARGLNDACASETIAWDVYNAYVIDKKRYDLVREDWVRSYSQCVKSPSNSTSSVTP
jgi:hypothetical protein